MRPRRRLRTAWSISSPPWGAGSLIVGDWLYAYACEKDKYSIAYSCLLGRVPLNRALDRGAWRFYARGSWSADWQTATPVLDAYPLLSVAWNAYVAKFVAVSARPISNQISIRMADRPEGPWSADIAIEGIPSVGEFPWVGPAVGHPELARDGGRVELVTYIRSVGQAANETRVVEIEFRTR